MFRPTSRSCAAAASTIRLKWSTAKPGGAAEIVCGFIGGTPSFGGLAPPGEPDGEWTIARRRDMSVETIAPWHDNAAISAVTC
jgi:hypothetical protein